MRRNPGTAPSASRITELLVAWKQGDEGALEDLTPLVYAELRQLAGRYLRRERRRATLETHDLIHETFVRLHDLQAIDWQDRVHFFAIAARIMRRILLDRARRRRNAKHGGGGVELRIAEIPDLAVERDDDLIALNDALADLEEFDERLARVVELRFFGGLDHDEVAAALGLSNPTVRRHWRFAKSWLHRRLSGSEAGELRAGG